MGLEEASHSHWVSKVLVKTVHRCTNYLLDGWMETNTITFSCGLHLLQACYF